MTKAEEMIRKQQEASQGTPAYSIGLQLIEIIRENGAAEKLVEEDLANPGMRLEKCAGALKEYADEKHRKSKGRCVCITPDEAETVIRKFYGLPERDETPPAQIRTVEKDVLSLEDLL